MVLLLSLIQVIAIALIIRWLCKKKCGEKFTKGFVALSIFLGFLSMIVVTAFAIIVWDGKITNLSNPYLNGILTALISASLFEETSKYIMFRIAALNKKQVATRLDAVLTSALVALGFTIIEDIVYSLDGNPGVLLRVILPCHFLFGVVMGYFYGMAKTTNKGIYHVLSLAAPIMLHTIFDGAPIGLSMALKDIDIEMLSDPLFEQTAQFKGFMIGALVSFLIFLIYIVLIVATFKVISKWSKEHELMEEINLSDNSSKITIMPLQKI